MVKLYRFGLPFTVCVGVRCFVISQTLQNIPLSYLCGCVCVYVCVNFACASIKVSLIFLTLFRLRFLPYLSVFMFWFVYTRPRFAFRFLACSTVSVFVCCFQYNGLFCFHRLTSDLFFCRTLAREHCIGKTQ